MNIRLRRSVRTVTVVAAYGMGQGNWAPTVQAVSTVASPVERLYLRSSPSQFEPAQADLRALNYVLIHAPDLGGSAA
jgi:hypothetical protein